MGDTFPVIFAALFAFLVSLPSQADELSVQDLDPSLAFEPYLASDAEYAAVSQFTIQGSSAVKVATAEAMAGFCSDEMPGDLEVCSGYLHGIAEFQEFVWSGQNAPIFCLPGGWDFPLLQRSVLTYLDTNMENWRGRPALGAVLAAFAYDFPCP
ncbi:MAG: hypothetical protein Unbinned664contig1000_48 [Prokaryotic dsDNA virus sp.]|nr:MAG: hypothetical protein Unbinned664contig1000_48 [Prokaryotic dsDNA virus sp.]|tara:strand:- start:1460 stop:1921 length:462 start_codon:yes stop_codon:yes gene_type:complete